jgi:hypothetical protein
VAGGVGVREEAAPEREHEEPGTHPACSHRGEWSEGGAERQRVEGDVESEGDDVGSDSNGDAR